jgi:hypothetical protein
MIDIRAFELIFSNEGKIIGNKELDIKSLKFKHDNIYQHNKKLDKNSILLTKNNN